MLSRRWSITWRLFRLLGKLLIYKTIKPQCWDIVALLLHEFLEGDGFLAATDWLQKAKSLICHQCSTSFLVDTPLLSSKQKYFLQSHALGCLSPPVFHLFSDTVWEEAWVVAVPCWATVRWTPSVCFTEAPEHPAVEKKIFGHYLLGLGVCGPEGKYFMSSCTFQDAGINPRWFSQALCANVEVHWPYQQTQSPSLCSARPCIAIGFSLFHQKEEREVM